MIVRELIEKLQALKNQDALIVINRKSPVDIQLLSGKITDGYFGSLLQPNSKGDVSKRYQAVTFTHYMELSDGMVILTEEWT